MAIQPAPTTIMAIIIMLSLIFIFILSLPFLKTGVLEIFPLYSIILLFQSDNSKQKMGFLSVKLHKPAQIGKND